MKAGFLWVALACSFGCLAQKTDKKLQRRVDTLVKGFQGVIGIYIKDLNSGRTVQLQADTVFPTASMVKVPIMIGMIDKISKGEIKYHQELVYRDSLKYSTFDIQAAYMDSQKTEVSRALMLMMTVSDNTASLWLQSLAGTGSRINAILDSLGFRQTRVNSRTPGREEYRNLNGWGQSTPREMAGILEKIYRGEVISKAASQAMLRLMSRNLFDRVSLSQLPPYAAVFAKYGAVNQTRNELVLVQGKKARYVFCVMSKNNKDQSWTDHNEAWVLTKKLSRMLWDYFEPKDKWEPEPDAGLYH